MMLKNNTKKLLVVKLIINQYKVINTILVFSCIIHQITNAHSYFFNEEQSNAILEHLNKPKVKIKKKKKRNKIEYKISGICYLGPSNWIVWINNTAYTKIGQYSNFSIDEVHPNGVTITTNDCKTMHLSVTCENNTNSIAAEK